MGSEMETAKPTPSSLGLNNEDLRDYREDLETLETVGLEQQLEVLEGIRAELEKVLNS